MHRREDDALQVLLSIYGSSKHENSALEQFQLATIRKDYREPLFISWRELGDGRNRTALGRSFALQLMQQLSGNSAIVYYTTVLFHNLGFSARESLLYNALASIPQFLVLIPLVFTLDRRGRRPALMLSQTGVILSLVVLGAATLVPDEKAKFWLLMFGVVLHRASFAAGLGPVPGVITPELLPFGIRARGMSVSSSFNWLVNFIVTISFPVLVQSLLPEANHLVYWGFALASLVGLIVVHLWVPETTGIPLDNETGVAGAAAESPVSVEASRVRKCSGMDARSDGANPFTDVWRPEADNLLIF